MYLHRVLKATRTESGQLLILVALVLPLLVLFAGFAIDFGFGFLTRAELAKASDAAALTIMHNLGQGQTAASQKGQDIFALNYNASSSLNATAPSLSISYSTDPTTNEPVVNTVATATVKTFFIRLAGFPTLTVSDSSQATRPPAILSLVLDRSGSMNNNGGAAGLPGAVTSFLNNFIQGADRLGEVSFSTLANADVPITTNFQTPITNSMNSMQFTGATYSYGGMLDGQAEVNGVASPPPNAVKVVVFFTDGYANTNVDTLNGTLEEYGGCSPIECTYVNCLSPFTGQGTGQNVGNGVGSCNGATTFPAQDPALGASPTMTRANISTEAEYRTVQLANAMRAQGITVYSIGLGTLVDQNFLHEVVNDSSSPFYDSTQPVGEVVFPQLGGDLSVAFQQIADKILLRLTQ